MSYLLTIAVVALEDYKPPTTLVNGHMVRFHVNTRQEYVSLGPWGGSRIMMHNQKLSRITIVFKAGGVMWLFEPATADEKALWRYYFSDTAYTQL